MHYRVSCSRVPVTRDIIGHLGAHLDRLAAHVSGLFWRICEIGTVELH